MDYKHAKVVFMGTPEIAASLLETLINGQFNIVAVIAQPDASFGRRNLLMKAATKIIAEKYDIPIFQPTSIRIDHDFINHLDADLIVTLAYGQIVPDAVLKWPKYRPLNVHGSLLPRLRGAAPIQYALMHGFKETGFTLMEMVTQMDAGPMYAQIPVTILDDDNYETLRNRMSATINTFVPLLLKQYLNDELKGIPQDVAQVSFAPSIKIEQEHLNIGLSSRDFINYVRALAPSPGGYVLSNDERIKLLATKLYNTSIDNEIGTVHEQNGKLLLQLIDGNIEITLLQIPGKRPTIGHDFLNGHRHYLGHLWK